MTILTNKDRAAVKQSLLKEAFEPRFDALAAKVEKALADTVKNEHPKFLQLRADPEAAPYVAATVNGELRLSDGSGFLFTAPADYSKVASNRRICARYYLADENLRRFRGGNVTVPPQMTDWKCEDTALLAEYTALWEEYAVAYRTLDDALSSFRTREKFTAAFPEFAKRLPPAPHKAGLPAVVTSDVLSKLAAVGVPAQ